MKVTNALGGQLIMIVGGSALLLGLYALLQWIGLRWYLLMLLGVIVAIAFIVIGLRKAPPIPTKDLSDLEEDQIKDIWRDIIKRIRVLCEQHPEYLYFPISFLKPITLSDGSIAYDQAWPFLLCSEANVDIERIERAIEKLHINTDAELFDLYELHQYVESWLSYNNLYDGGSLDISQIQYILSNQNG